MTKSKILWLLLIACFIGSLIFVCATYSKVNSLVNLHITMDRSTALSRAAELKKKYFWGPNNAQSAAKFSSNDFLEAFVELEAGGKKVFNSLLESRLISPYVWTVRFFREGEVNETQVWFTPTGNVCGFRESLSENVVLPTLSEGDARALAEKSAREDWKVDLDTFKPIETSQQICPSGRIDHVFVYEHSTETLGVAHYRLQFVVCGNRLTEMTQSVTIPDAFSRRYQNMRSTNDAIAGGADFILFGLYMFIGCLGGIVLLLRSNYLLWKTASIIAIILAFLEALSSLNDLPSQWMQYDTAQAPAVFLANYTYRICSGFVFSVLLLAFTFMAAESLTRRAFPQFIQFWRIWNPSIAASSSVAGQTAIGFLMVGILMAYDSAVYLIGNNCFHWWSPSEALVDPNILSMYCPWLTPLANALHAGLWEECLCRAVPLSIAALIGARLGRPRLVLGITIVGQAIVFGALHANYPQEPPYVRIVEIAPAFFVFGLIYLRFGLLPVVLAHFGTDMVEMSLPIFFTHTSTIWIDRTIVVLILLIPIGVVAAATWLRGGWHPLQERYLNRGWVPLTPQPGSTETDKILITPAIAFTRRQTILSATIALLALGAWYWLTDFHLHGERLALTRTQARQIARQELINHKLLPNGTWTIRTSILTGQDQADRYIWQQYGSQVYDKLEHLRYLATPVWQVTWVRFDPSIEVAERAECFWVMLTDNGELVRLDHELPEARAGTNLQSEDARRMATAFLKNDLKLNLSTQKEIAAIPQKRPNRIDWFITYANTEIPLFKNNELQTSVSVANDTVLDYTRSFHTPEAWIRNNQGRTAITGLITSICRFAFEMLYIVGTILGVIRWSKGRLNLEVFLKVGATYLFLGVLTEINSFPQWFAFFSTAQPLANQYLQVLAGNVLSVVIFGFIATLLTGLFTKQRNGTPIRLNLYDITVALSAGFCTAALFYLIKSWTPLELPIWPSYTSANTYLPWLEVILDTAQSFIIDVAVLGLIFTLVNEGVGSHKLWLRLAALWVFGMVLAGIHIHEISIWIIEGSAKGILIFLLNEYIFRSRIYLLPITYAAYQAVGLVREILLNGYVGSVVANSCAILILLTVAHLYTRYLMGCVLTTAKVLRTGEIHS